MKIVIVGYGSVSSALLPLLASELRNEISSLKIIAPCIQNKCTHEHGLTIAWQLNIKAIHIAEHDTQASKHVKAPGEFVNTWSVAGFIGEACQPSELGRGTHEVKLPAEAVFHNPATKKTIYLNRPGASVRLKTWTPAYGPSLGFLITHNESISLADYLTYNISSEKHYRPTVAYAYHPCNDAILSIHELNGNSLRPQQQHRVLQGHDIIGGADYLGVLLMGHEKNAYWYGSVLKNSIAQSLSPASSATTLQVAAGVLAGVKWALKHPRQGIVESEEMDFHFILGVAHRYLGDMVGTYTDWNPTNINGPFFSCDADMGDVWQFANFLE